MAVISDSRLPPGARDDIRSRSFPLSPLPDRSEAEPPAPEEDLAEATLSPDPAREEKQGETEELDDRPRLRRPSQLNARSTNGRSLYERIGRTIGVRRLVRRFFDLMETLPEAAPCRGVYPADLEDSRQKFFEFMNGWLGGPKLYLKRHGAPKLRRRHFLINIGPAQRDAWLLCFRRAAEETITDHGAIDMLMPQVESIAYYLQNRD
jgi:hemoglobin